MNVRDHRTKGRIVIRAEGPQAARSSVFGVTLTGPGSVREHEAFGTDRTVTFAGLRPGDYRLTTDTKADIPVRVRPADVTVHCTAKKTTEVELEFS